ncbi:MAG TPA: NUDIX domain-containing protein [Anaerolineales bacterium]|jgi:ADP-ribose pyrophosphatase YjhB (NUDIX family)
MDGKECKIHKLVADVLVLAQGQVLLARYDDVRKYDGQEGWFLPDDYLAYGEHPHDAARRILREQVGLDTDGIALSYIESFGGEGGGIWHLIFHHKVELDQIPGMTPLTNVRAAEWFPLEHLPERPAVAHEGWAIDVIEEILK